MLEIIDIQAMNHVSSRLVSLLTMTFVKGFFVKLSANNTALKFAFSNIDFPIEIVKNFYRVSYRNYYLENVI